MPKDANSGMTKRDKKRFAKLLCYSIAYHREEVRDACDGIYDYSNDYIANQVYKLGIPEGWDKWGDPFILEKWFIENCTKSKRRKTT